MSPSLVSGLILALSFLVLTSVGTATRALRRTASRPQVQPLLFERIVHESARPLWRRAARPETHPDMGRLLRRALVVAESLDHRGDTAAAAELRESVRGALDAGDLSAALRLDLRARAAFRDFR